MGPQTLSVARESYRFRLPMAFGRQEHQSAASSASLRSVLRGVPIGARMVRLRAKSVTWIAGRPQESRTGFRRRDPVPETTFHQRGATGGRFLQELPDLSVVHNRRDAHHKASPSGAFLGRTLDGVPQKARDRVAKTLWRQQRLRGCAPFRLRIPLGRARISSACHRRRHTGSAFLHPSRRRDLRSSRRRSLSTRTPGSPFPAPPVSSKLRGRPRGLASF